MRTMITALLFMALVISAMMGPTGCRQKEIQGPPAKLTLAVDPTPYAGLVAIADEKGFFKQAGVEVAISLHPSGLDSLKAVVRGEAEIATISDIAFALKMKEDASLRIIASIGASAGSRVVARKDRNIREPADLKGKKIGYSPGTASDYFFHAFLLTNRLSRKNVTAVPIPAARQAEALLSGEVDAVSAFDTYAFAARKALGKNAVSWDSQNKIGYQWLLAARESSTRPPEAIKRLLIALVKAEDFLLAHQDEAKSIIARKWKLDPEYVDHAWGWSRMGVSFNQSIVTALQNYATWRTRREGKSEDRPDVLPYLYPDPLKEVDRKSVTIFR